MREKVTEGFVCVEGVREGLFGIGFLRSNCPGVSREGDEPGSWMCFVRGFYGVR